MKPIDEISTPELIEELMERCSPAIFIGTKDEGIIAGGSTNYFQYSGRESVCYGLCHELAFEILTKRIENGDS